MAILVTGATGFIGSYLQKELITKNKTFKAITRKNNTLGSNEIVCDISSKTDWSANLKDIDVVIHLAGCAHKNFTKDEYLEFNFKSTKNFAKQAANLGVKKFIYISTLNVHGDVGINITSTSPILLSSLAAESKYKAEQTLKNSCKLSNMKFVIIRPPLVYGSGVKANFATMMKWVYKGIPLPLGGIRNNQRSLVSVDNLVDLIITCIDHPKAANQTFLVSDDEDVSTTGLLQNMAKELNVPSRLLPIPASWFEVAAKLIGKPAIAQRLCDSLQVDISETKEVLNWKPPISFSEGLQKTAKAFLENLNN